MRGRPEADEAPSYYFRYIDLVSGDDVLAALARQLQSPLERWRQVSEARSRFRYAAGKWSARQVIGHLSDTERIFAGRALWFARGLGGALPGFESDACALAAAADEVPWAALLAEFEAARRSSLELFRNLPAAAWTRRGVASGFTFSVRALACIAVGHVEHHASELRARYFRTEEEERS